MSKKQTDFFIAFIFMIPILGIFLVLGDIYVSKNCKKIGKKYKIETREKFPMNCQFLENGKWQTIHKFQIPQKEILSYPQAII